jgi:hypothetical protein
MKTWVITWRWLDRSGSGVVPFAFKSIESAEKICAFLATYDSREFLIHELETI